MNPLLTAQKITFQYNDRPVLRGIDFSANSGELVAILGPNGSGKTTLLKILAGILAPQAGKVTWSGRALRAYTRREIARQIAMVPQELNLPYAFSVEEVVSLGRTPYFRPFNGESRRDLAATQQALALTNTQILGTRLFSELSGGERQRVVIAMALAQEPQLLLLDEPTVHLDINHQIEVLELIHRLNRERGLTVIASMHDLNLAALYFDHLILLSDGTIVVEGSPRTVLTKEIIHRVFRAEVALQTHPARTDSPNVILLPPNGKDN